MTNPRSSKGRSQCAVATELEHCEMCDSLLQLARQRDEEKCYRPWWTKKKMMMVETTKANLTATATFLPEMTVTRLLRGFGTHWPFGANWSQHWSQGGARFGAEPAEPIIELVVLPKVLSGLEGTCGRQARIRAWKRTALVQGQAGPHLRCLGAIALALAVLFIR